MGDRGYRRREEEDRGAYRRREEDDRDRFSREKRRREDDEPAFRRGPPGRNDRDQSEKIYLRDDRSLPGRIIGKEGAIIKRIERDSRCRINIVTPKKPGDEPPHVNLSGASEDIARAKDEIMKVIHQWERENGYPLSDGSPGGFNGPTSAPAPAPYLGSGPGFNGGGGQFAQSGYGSIQQQAPLSPRQQSQQQMQQHPLYTALQDKFKKEQDELVQRYKNREDAENMRHQAELKVITDELSAELKTLNERQAAQKSEFEKNLKTLLSAVLQQAPAPISSGYGAPAQPNAMQFGPPFGQPGQPQGLMMGSMGGQIMQPQPQQQSQQQQSPIVHQISGGGARLPGQQGAPPYGMQMQAAQGGMRPGPVPPQAPPLGMAPSPYSLPGTYGPGNFSSAGQAPPTAGQAGASAPMPTGDQLSMLQAILAAQKAAGGDGGRPR